MPIASLHRAPVTNRKQQRPWLLLGVMAISARFELAAGSRACAAQWFSAPDGRARERLN
jgi:hypothetical protein